MLATTAIGHKLIARAEIGGRHNAVNVGTNHIDNNFAYGTSGSAVIDGAGSYGGSGTAAVTGGSGQWTTGTAQWTTTVAKPVGSGTAPKKPSSSSKSKLPNTLPKTGY